MTWKEEVQEIKKRQEFALKMGGSEGIERQHNHGKLTVRERIQGLVDPGSFNEFMGLMGRATYEKNELQSVLPKGAVEGFCKLDGVYGLFEAIFFFNDDDVRRAFDKLAICELSFTLRSFCFVPVEFLL